MKKKVQILMIHGGMTFKNKADYLRFLKTRQISIEKKIKMKNLNLKSDKYRKSRGGYSRFLDIYCDHCGKKNFYLSKRRPGRAQKVISRSNNFGQSSAINFFFEMCSLRSRAWHLLRISKRKTPDISVVRGSDTETYC